MYIKSYKNFHDRAELRTKRTALTAVKEFGLNLFKLPDRLKNDKTVVLQAIESDPFAIRMVPDEKVRRDPEISEKVLEKKKYLAKYIDPLGEEINVEKGYLTNKEKEMIEMRNSKYYELEQERAIRLGRSASELDR